MSDCTFDCRRKVKSNSLNHAQAVSDLLVASTSTITTPITIITTTTTSTSVSSSEPTASSVLHDHAKQQQCNHDGTLQRQPYRSPSNSRPLSSYTASSASRGSSNSYNKVVQVTMTTKNSTSTYHKAKTVFQINVANPPKSSEKSLDLLFTSLIGQPPNINTAHSVTIKQFYSAVTTC